MHEKVLPPGSLKILDGLETIDSQLLKGWILAGGTGLALRLGHRLSVDFDFFRNDSINLEGLHEVFEQIESYETLQSEERTLSIDMNGVNLSFFILRTKFLFDVENYRFFSISDIRDIAAMKIAAIEGRGSRKDFIDLFFIFQKTSLTLQNCIDMYEQKFGSQRLNRYQVIKSITWFEEAEKDPMPEMLEPFDWDECKKDFQERVKEILPL